MARLLWNFCAALLGLASLPSVLAASWWKPNATEGLGFNYQLGTSFSSNFYSGVQVYFIDGESSTKEMVQSIKAKGYYAVCYFSAGSFEDWRSDASSFPASVLGKGLDGWPGEKWLDVRQISVLQPIMKQRMADWCQSKGFDAVDPDNMDGYQNDSGFPEMSGTDQIKYNKMIADAAHSLGLAAGLKNDVDQIVELEASYDFFVNEQCFQYNECDKYLPAKNANKPVFNVEYKATPFQRGCRCQSKFGLTTIRKTLSLKPRLTTCSARIKDKNCRYS